MFQTQRKTCPRVKHGRVQRKNRSDTKPDLFEEETAFLRIEHRRAGRGFRHLVRKEDVRRFLKLLPNWNELREGLRAVVLDGGQWDCIGWHNSGVIAICAWDSAIEWHDCYPEFLREHAALFEKLDIAVERGEEGQIVVRFTESTARAFQLIHVLVHELGHHHDRMTTKSRQRSCRGEGYAEAYARRFEDEILKRYRKEFAI